VILLHESCTNTSFFTLIFFMCGKLFYKSNKVLEETAVSSEGVTPLCVEPNALQPLLIHDTARSSSTLLT